MKGIKRKALYLLSVICLFVLAACGGNIDSDNAANGSNESDSEQKTIEFMHLWPEGSSKQHYEIVNGIIDEFESENPDVTVDVEILGNEQYKEKLKVLSTSNELPDVGMAWPAGFLEPYVSGDKFAELDDLLDGPLNDSFVAGTAEAYEIDGATYSLPLELNITPIYYNQRIFDENGIEVPTTFEELKGAIQTLIDQGITPIALGNKDRWTGSMWYMYLADRIGGPEVLNSAIDRSGSFGDEALVQAAEEVKELVDMGAFINGFNGLGNDEAKGYFINEQAAMYLMATWDLPEWTTNEDNPQELRDAVEYMKFPTVEGGEGDTNSYVGGPGVGLFVAENSDVKDEAKDFVAFFVEKWGEKSVTDAGVIPATKVDTDGIELPQMYIDILNDLNEASNLTLYADVQMSPGVAEVHLDMIQALFGGVVTPEEFTQQQEEALAAEE
ncbi:extracellular solute-binding protein [Gracilibacillus phocaeensis]|uniref:extracellular solute-binding protein n=1 Tax=Gracilibacillus phocaeensis TaxID=2042304 RepID=UPI00103242F6|nr:extracellular solute-binding protein [Gracilibacillus phocaeensis]